MGTTTLSGLKIGLKISLIDVATPLRYGLHYVIYYFFNREKRVAYENHGSSGHMYDYFSFSQDDNSVEMYYIENISSREKGYVPSAYVVNSE